MRKMTVIFKTRDDLFSTSEAGASLFLKLMTIGEITEKNIKDIISRGKIRNNCLINSINEGNTISRSKSHIPISISERVNNNRMRITLKTPKILISARLLYLRIVK